MVEPTPVSLLDRLCKEPDEPHWERFVSLFTPILSRWGNRLGVPAADIEDVLQDVYTILFRKLPEFRYDPAKSFAPGCGRSSTAKHSLGAVRNGAIWRFRRNSSKPCHRRTALRRRRTRSIGAC